MKVSVILQNKSSRDVATIAPEASIAEAAAQLSELGIGALVVSPGGGSIAGILSERDIVRRLSSHGPAVLQDRVDVLMTAEVETCTATETALDVLGRMTAGRFRHMPVIGPDERMVGILSIGDVVKARLEEIETENAAMADMLSG